MGRQDLFPVVVFTIILVAALAAIISINSVTGPWKLPDRGTKDIVGQAYLPTQTIPAGYAPPYDLYLDNQVYVFASGTKSGSNAALTVNVTKLDEVDRQYIYKTGKYSNGNAWKDFTFNTPTASGSNWILNEANFTGAASELPYGETHVIVYVCKKYQGLEGLKCGPKRLNNTRNWTIQSLTVAYPACTSTQNQFCNTANTSVLPNTSINSSASCTGSEVCFKCINGAVNQSKTCVVPQYTCESTTNQICGTNIGNASNTTSTGTCPAGQYCFKCNNNYQKNGTRCDPIPTCTDQCIAGRTICMPDGKVRECTTISGCLNWGAPSQCSGAGVTCIGDTTSGACINMPGACTLTTGQICGPATTTPTNMTSGTGVCAGGQSCYKCADGYAYNSTSGTCTFNCNTQNCPSPKVCDPAAKTCLPPNCPSTCAASNVTCGTTVTSVAGCSQCPAGNGTKCTTAGQSCNTNTWQCQCVPDGTCNNSTNTCSTTGTNSCGQSCTRTTQGNTCTLTGSTQSGTCNNGQCQPSCTDECTTRDATQCSSTNVQTCGNYDTDTCLEWSTPAACPIAGQICSGTSCQASQCAYLDPADPPTTLTCNTCTQKAKTTLSINSLTKFRKSSSDSSLVSYTMCCASAGQCADIYYNVFTDNKMPECKDSGTVMTPGNGNTYTCQSGNWQCSGTSCPCTSDTQCTGGTTCQNGFCTAPACTSVTGQFCRSSRPTNGEARTGFTCTTGSCYACSTGYTWSGSACVQDCRPTTEICDGQDNDCDSQIDESGVCTVGCTYAGTDIPSQHLKCPNAGCTNTIYADYKVDPTGTQTFNNKYLGACCSSSTDCVDPSTNACVAQESKWLYSLCKNKLWYPCYEGVATMQITIGSQSYKCDAPAQLWFKCGGTGQAPCSSDSACTYSVYNGGAGPTPPKGSTWTGAPVVTGTASVCCALSKCGAAGQCYDEGIMSGGQHWICATAPSQSQAAWYVCDSNNVGKTFTSNEGNQFCCNTDTTPGSTGYKFTVC